MNEIGKTAAKLAAIVIGPSTLRRIVPRQGAGLT